MAINKFQGGVQVKGKIKLPDELANKAIIIDGSGEVSSSGTSSTELGYLSGVTSSVQTQIGSKADSSALSTHIGDTANPHSVTKSQVGLGNVDNTSDANKPVSTAQGAADTAVQNFSIQRSNHTGSQTASTISDFSSAAKSAAVADSITNAITDVAPSQNAVFDALALKADLASPTFTGTVSGITKSMVGLGNVDNTSDANKPISTATQTALDNKADLVSGKLATSQIPALAITDTFVVADQTAMLALTAQTGDIAIRSDESKTYILQGSNPTVLGDWIYLATPASAVLSVNSQTGVVVLSKSDISLGNVDNTSDATKNSATATLTNKTLTSPVINSPTGIVKADVGLGNVDNTSDANKPVSTAAQTALDLKANLASPTFTGTVSGITASMVGLGNVDNIQQLPLSYLDTDGTLAANSDVKVASQKAVKTYVTSAINNSGVASDIALTSFSAADNQAAAANVTGLAFAAGTVRGFKALVSVAIDGTADLFESFELLGINKGGSFDMAVNSVGDDSGIVFSITSAGQVKYTSTAVAGFVSSTIKFRAQTTTV